MTDKRVSDMTDDEVRELAAAPSARAGEQGTVTIRRDDADELLTLAGRAVEAQAGAREGTAWGRVFRAVHGRRGDAAAGQ